MVLKGLAGKIKRKIKEFKNYFKKEEEISKKIKKDREELLRDLHELLTILYQQQSIRPYCHNNEYRVVIDNNSRIIFCRILGNINAMYRLAQREYNKLSAETGQLDRELSRLNKEYYEALRHGKLDDIRKKEEEKLRLIKDLNVKQDEKTIFLNIMSLHGDNKHLVIQLMWRIKNKAIKKELSQLDKLIKEEEKIIDKLKKHIEEENKLFAEEIRSIKKLYDVIQY
jgi:peptidoglycan hydrolase CwlO-like protein